MQWYDVVGLVLATLALVPSFYKLFNLIKSKMPAKLSASIDNYFFRKPILYCREFQDYFVFVALRLTKMQSAKKISISNAELSFRHMFKEVRLTPLMPPEIGCIKSFKDFYEKYENDFYGNVELKDIDYSRTIVFAFLITDRNFIKRQSTEFTFTCNFGKARPKRFVKTFTLLKEDIGPYLLAEIEEHASIHRPNPFDPPKSATTWE